MGTRIIPVSLSALVLVLGLCSQAAAAEFPAITGTEPGIWWRHTVVYGDVTHATSLRAEYGDGWVWLLTVQVRSTLAGFWDPAANPVAKVELYHVYHERPGFPKSQMPDPFPVNHHVVVVIARLNDGRYMVPPASIEFMPEQRGIVVVDGFDDRKVSDIVAKLREARPDFRRLWKGHQRSPPGKHPPVTKPQAEPALDAKRGNP